MPKMEDHQLKAEFSNLIKFVKPSKRKLEINTQYDQTKYDPSKNISLSGSEASAFYSTVLKSKESDKASTNRKNRQCATSAKKQKREETSVGDISNITLFHASQNGDLKIVEQCLKCGIDVNMVDDFGWTALMCASGAGHLDIVRLLTQHGADLKTCDQGGNNALSIATKSKRYSVVKFLKSVQLHGLPCSSDQTSKDLNPEQFFCDICKREIKKQEKKVHDSSTVHLFNRKLKPKKDNFDSHAANRGYQIMRKSGWDGQHGLGAEGQGQKFPVKTVLKHDRHCLGSTAAKTSKAKVTHFGPNDPKSVQKIDKNPERKMTAKTLGKRAMKREEQKKKSWEQNLRWEMNFDL